METSPEELQRLSALVERFRVCWEVWPEYIYVKHEKRQIGFSLELCGTHEAGVEHPTAGCEHCLHVIAVLHAIAAHILPRETRPSSYEIRVYDQAIHYPPKRGNRPEVVLPIKILHRHGFESPVDDCEVLCLNDMKLRLRALGASEGRWVAPAVPGC